MECRSPPSREEIEEVGGDEEAAQDRGWDVLGHGTLRTVFGVDGCAIKYSIVDGSHNQKEAANWEYAQKAGVDENFAGVVAVAEDGSWLVQDRADRTPALEQGQLQRELRKDECTVGDLAPMNTGSFEEGPKVVDYGDMLSCRGVYRE